ncbi:MAG: hypothetical protein DBY04_00605 [Clostridiales bacterium]|nr:MAG: hypothetical protein DBY04_00605 [Clostridiales bacterium]
MRNECKIVDGTYFDEDNGEYRSYGISVEIDGERTVVEDITVDIKKIEDLVSRINKYGLSLRHVDEYVYDWLCEVYGF